MVGIRAQQKGAIAFHTVSNPAAARHRRDIGTTGLAARPDTIVTNPMSYLPKDVFYLFKQAARFRLVLNGLTQLSQQLALAFVQLVRGLYPDLHVQISLARALQCRNACAAQAEDGP